MHTYIYIYIWQFLFCFDIGMSYMDPLVPGDIWPIYGPRLHIWALGPYMCPGPIYGPRVYIWAQGQ